MLNILMLLNKLLYKRIERGKKREKYYKTKDYFIKNNMHKIVVNLFILIYYKFMMMLITGDDYYVFFSSFC